MFDSHAHLVSPDTRRYPPTPLKGDLDRVLSPFEAEDLIREMDSAGVERAVAVQRAHVYGFNNDYVADAAAAFPDRLVSVGMIDTLDPEAVEHVRYWVRERGMAGIRMTEAVKGSGTGWVSGPVARDVWRAATEIGASVCFHFMRWNRTEGLAALREMCALFPDTVVVVDHFSNLIADSGGPDFGLDAALAELVPFPKVFQKFTTINVSKLAEVGLTCAPVVAHMVATFGADRVMWGSDVAQSKGSYAEMVHFARDATATLSAPDRARVLYGTASAVYGKRAGSDGE